MNIQISYTTKELMKIFDSSFDTTISRRAKRENWQSEKRVGRGGGHAWLYESMPLDTRMQILNALEERRLHEEVYSSAGIENNTLCSASDKMVSSICGVDSAHRVSLRGSTNRLALGTYQSSDDVNSKKPQENKGDLGNARAAARTLAVSLFKAWKVDKLGSETKLVNEFAKMWARGEVSILPWARDTLARFTGKSLLNWMRTISTQGSSALSGDYGKRVGVFSQNQELLDTCLGLIYEFPHISGTILHESLCERFENITVVPKLRRVQEWLKKWKEENKQMYLELLNPDAYRSKYMVAFGSTNANSMRMNQVWEMDSTPWDIITSDNKRHNITGLIDIRTRSIQLYSSRTSSAHSVASTLRRGITDFGVPESVHTDNGKDYTAQYIVQFMVDMEILQELCPPFSPWKKPHIERVFRSFSHDLLEYLDGFVGHNVAERKAIEERKAFSKRLFSKDNGISALYSRLSSEELQGFLDDWVLRYHHKAHSGLGGATPFEVKQECIAKQVIRRVFDERALDMLLLPLASGQGGYRTVGKKGVRAGIPGEYVAPELATYIGQRVQPRLDDTNLGLAYIFDDEGQFICVAKNNLMENITMEDAKEAKRLQKEARQLHRKQLALAAKHNNVREIPQEILASSVAKARAIEEEFSVNERKITHESESMKQALFAMNAQVEEVSEEKAHELQELREEAKASIHAIQIEWRAPDTARGKFLLAQDVLARVEAGEHVLMQERNFTYNYIHSSEYVGQKTLSEFLGKQSAVN